MGDFVTEDQVKRIRAHFDAYRADVLSLKDNRGYPSSGVEDASTFREVSTHYVERLLRYIEVEQFLREQEARDGLRDRILEARLPQALVSRVLSYMSRAAVRLHQAVCRHEDRTKSPYSCLGECNWWCHDCGADWWRNWRDEVGVGPRP